MATGTLTGEALAEARAWLADCAWEDIDADGIAALSDLQVTRAIARHYDNGLAGFLASGF